MATVLVPEGGLELAPANPSGQDGMDLPQIIQLDLENGMLYDMMKAARHGTRPPQFAFGKTLSLHYGTKTRALSSKPTTFPSFLYNGATEEFPRLQVAGQLTHKLELEKAKEDTAASDDALVQLQKSLASAKQEKQSNQIKFYPDSSALPPAKRQTAASLKQQSAKKGSLANLRREKLLSLSKDSIIQSLPASPAMAPFRPPVFTSLAQQEDQKQKRRRDEAIRKSLIHLLAHRQLSAKYLAQKVKCKEDDLREVLSRIGKPWSLDNSKWDLKDSAFRALNVWSFPYPDPEDRQLAIDRAVTVYDRLRISPNDEIFQRLLPERERNKGKSLSKLDHLNKGPIKPNGTPKIHIQRAEESVKSSENDRSRKVQTETGKAETMVLSKPPPRKTKPSEKEAKSKHLLSKRPKSTIQEKDSQSVNKKAAKKDNAPLSAEFVNDSDEEDGLEESMAFEVNPIAPKPKVDHKDRDKKQDGGKKQDKEKEQNRDKKQDRAKPRDWKSDAARQKPGSNPTANGLVKPRPIQHLILQDDRVTQTQGQSVIEESRIAQKAPKSKSEVLNASKKRKAPEPTSSDRGTAKRPRNGSSSHKPSPLGSSPPTNASELEGNDNSSASSPPLIPMNSRNASAPTNVNGHARKTSEKPLKRKADGLDHTIHMRKHTSDVPNGIPNGRMNPAKRLRANELTPPSSDSPSPPLKSSRVKLLKKASMFKKKYYPEYKKLYQELQEMELPPSEQVEELERKHKQIVELKQEIKDESERLRSSE